MSSTIKQQVFATLIISGWSAPIGICGNHAIADMKNAIRQFQLATTKPAYKKGEIIYYNNWFFIDEFCVTFLDWVRIHECSNPNCMEKAGRDALIDTLCDKCIEQTCMYIDGLLTRTEYSVYRMLVNLLHRGVSITDAKHITQGTLNVQISDNTDQFTSQFN